MKSLVRVASLFALLSASGVHPAAALDGEPYIHDPSTVAYDNGKYYAFGTGGGGLISDDGGWTWHGGAVRPGGGVAPDILKIGDRYYVTYATGGGGMSGGHASNEGNDEQSSRHEVLLLHFVRLSRSSFATTVQSSGGS